MQNGRERVCILYCVLYGIICCLFFFFSLHLQFGALTPLEPRLGKKLIEPLTNLIHRQVFIIQLLFVSLCTTKQRKQPQESVYIFYITIKKPKRNQKMLVTSLLCILRILCAISLSVLLIIFLLLVLVLLALNAFLSQRTQH